MSLVACAATTTTTSGAIVVVRRPDENNNDDTNKTSGQKMKALTEMIKENTIKTIIEQKRPGGLLAKGS